MSNVARVQRPGASGADKRMQGFFGLSLAGSGSSRSIKIRTNRQVGQLASLWASKLDAHTSENRLEASCPPFSAAEGGIERLHRALLQPFHVKNLRLWTTLNHVKTRWSMQNGVLRFWNWSFFSWRSFSGRRSLKLCEHFKTAKFTFSFCHESTTQLCCDIPEAVQHNSQPHKYSQYARARADEQNRIDTCSVESVLNMLVPTDVHLLFISVSTSTTMSKPAIQKCS